MLCNIQQQYIGSSVLQSYRAYCDNSFLARGLSFNHSIFTKRKKH